MRIYSNCKELMSEIGRELNSYGAIVKPKVYQDVVIENNEEMITKEIICQQYCLTGLKQPEYLFAYTKTQEWAKAEFEERVSGDRINPGKAWELNKPMWEEFIKDGKFSYTYSERINQLVRVMSNPDIRTKLDLVLYLLKNDPDTRKAIINIYDSSDSNNLLGDQRIPCSMYYDFLIRDCGRGKQLNICYHQRSADFIGHFGDDVYLAWQLMEFMSSLLDIKPGYLYHTIDSLHCYKKDWYKLSSNIENLI